MLTFNLIILTMHYVLLILLCLLGLHRLSMVLRWFYYRNHRESYDEVFGTLPKVTVQVPLYNERFVAQRIVDAIAAINYPSDKLQLQVVDDSTDGTVDIIANRIAFYQGQGIPIVHVRRPSRDEFKAGALKEAMKTASGEFIAVFDADFVPYPSILRDTIHYFTDSHIGMVQYRWEHLNRHSSPLTEAQAMMLDAHFGLEQWVRSASGLFLNFNGTAGIWRSQAIIDAGHWSADTLTEDLDLSYRAQLRGWKMLYLNDIACAGEIPADMNAFKSQQHRWAKGGIEVMLKMLGKVWAAPTHLKYKIESTFHLSNNLAYLFLLLDIIVFLIPAILIREKYGIEYIWWLDLPLLMLSTGSHLVYLIFGQVVLNRSKKAAILNAPRLFLVGIQLSFNNARAGFEALVGYRSEFVRTPKSGDLKSQKGLEQQTRRLYKPVAPKGAVCELLLAMIFMMIFIWGVINQFWIMLPFLLFFIFGYATTAISSFVSYQRLKT